MKSKKRKTYYPIFLNLKNKACVAIGGGQVAFRKVKTLLECGAHVTVVSPVLHSGLSRLAMAGSIRVIPRCYQSGDLRGAVIVVSATNDEKTNQRIAAEAKKRGVFVNVVDDPGRSDFIVPSFLRRGGLTIAVSTSGMSPALAKKIRGKLERDFGKEYTSLVSLVEEVRSALKRKKIRPGTDAWQEALDLDLLIQLVRAHQQKKAKAILIKRLEP